MKRFYPPLAAVAFLLLNISLSHCSKEALFAEEPDDFVSKFIGGPGHETGEDIVQGPDGSFYLTGSTTTESNGGSDILIAKLSETGELLWSHNYGSVGNDIGKAILFGSDGIVWVTGNWGRDICLLGVDMERGEMVEKEVYRHGPINWRETAEDVVETSGGFFIGGSQDSLSDQNFYLLKAASSGDFFWDQRYGNSQKTETGKQLQVSLNNGIHFLGSSRREVQNSSKSHFQVVSITDNGGLGTAFDFLESDTSLNTIGTGFVANSIELMILGTRISAGDSSIYLFKGNKETSPVEIIWEREYSFGFGVVATALQVTRENEVLVIGHQWSEPERNSDLFLMKINSEGMVDWHLHEGGDGLDFGNAVIESRDGAVVCIGTHEYDGYSMAWVRRIQKSNIK